MKTVILAIEYSDKDFGNFTGNVKVFTSVESLINHVSRNEIQSNKDKTGWFKLSKYSFWYFYECEIDEYLKG